jgi:hypothetical protein
MRQRGGFGQSNAHAEKRVKQAITNNEAMDLQNQTAVDPIRAVCVAIAVTTNSTTAATIKSIPPIMAVCASLTNCPPRATQARRTTPANKMRVAWGLIFSPFAMISRGRIRTPPNAEELLRAFGFTAALPHSAGIE